MTGDKQEELGVVTQLVRRQQALVRPRLQFTMRTLLIGTAYFACLVWLVQFIVRTEPLGIPIYMHLWFLFLWISAITGAYISQDAWWYFMGGAIGLALGSPILLDIYVHDLTALPLVTGWSSSFVFAMFANLGGGIHGFRTDRQSLALVNTAAFLFSAAVIAIYVSM
jgi:hypothetical protein